jgi:hypothetical protein
MSNEYVGDRQGIDKDKNITAYRARASKKGLKMDGYMKSRYCSGLRKEMSNYADLIH